jgi:ATP-dependent protease Clp ATPase subunit
MSLQKKLQELSPEQMLEYCQKRIQGQERELKKAVYIVYKYLRQIADGTLKQADNWLLTAPSGSGKTEFYRALRDYFEQNGISIPVIQFDLSQITETGYKGNNVDVIPKNILKMNMQSGGYAICFLDEADKKCVPSYSSGHININAAIQANLLTMIEGIRLNVEVDDEETIFDSGKTMFVFMGAFQQVRNNKKEKQNRSASIGFGAERQKRIDADEVSDGFYDDLSIQELVDYGMMEELAGRLTQIINFHKLTKEHMRVLLQCKVREIGEEMGIEIEMTKAALEEFLTVSFGSLGVRRPMNLIRELSQNAVAEVFFDSGFDARMDVIVIESMETARIKHKRAAKGSQKHGC